MLQRRQFLMLCAAAAIAPKIKAQALPWKIGHRQANMTKEPGPGVFDIAKRIPGISGVELQIQFQGTSLWDADTLQSYKKSAADAGLALPSLAGVWKPGTGLMQIAVAEDTIRKSIQAAEALKAKVILVAAFEKNCPDMQKEESYGPVVAMLKKVAPAAANAGVTVGMETSLDPAGDKKLIDLVDHRAIGVYYDADNVERYEHKNRAVPGYEILGKRIAQIHIKNESMLLEEPGRVNWTDALKAIRRTGYQGWLVFESSHSDPDQCVEATKKNLAFIKRTVG